MHEHTDPSSTVEINFKSEKTRNCAVSQTFLFFKSVVLDSYPGSVIGFFSASDRVLLADNAFCPSQD